MALWVCTKCGLERDARCKPRKCPQCEEKTEFEKKKDKGKK